MPQAVAVMFEVIKSNIPSTDKLDLVLEFDQVLGLKLSEAHEEEVPEEIKVLVQQRKLARDQKDWQKSDELRNEIESKGYILEDTSTGYKVKKK
jgi:cysteinyl-tRNA synthetase